MLSMSTSFVCACFAALLFESVVLGETPLKLLQTEQLLSPQHEISVSITIDQGRDIVELNMVGPADVYYAVGFGSNEMAHTWAIVVNGEGDEGWFEQTLSDHTEGEQHAVKSFELLQNSLSAQTKNMRRVHLRKALSSLQSFHPFDATQDSIDIIWAVGSDTDFTKHIESGTKVLLYDIMDTLAPHLR